MCLTWRYYKLLTPMCIKHLMSLAALQFQEIKKPSSRNGLDQKRKQHNKDVRGDGSVLGLAEDEEKLQN